MSIDDERTELISSHGDDARRPASDPGDVEDGAPTMRLGRARPEIPEVELDEEIGRGGMGVVYSGRQSFVDRKVAVKVLTIGTEGSKPRIIREHHDRFRREAKILANLSHENIVACYGGGVTTDERCYLIMELIEGPNLRGFIRQNGALEERHALAMVRDLAKALAYAQADFKIIHRDVKCENVLLQEIAPRTAVDPFPFRPKLTDLGLARPEKKVTSGDMSVTEPGALVGTPMTMAPEQYDDPDNIDFRADVYGLGCVLFQALTSETPFQQTSVGSLLKEKLMGETPDPRKLRGEVSDGTAQLVRDMLASGRDERPASWSAVIERCEALHAAADPTAKTVRAAPGDLPDAPLPEPTAPRPPAAPTAPERPAVTETSVEAPPIDGGGDSPIGLIAAVVAIALLAAVGTWVAGQMRDPVDGVGGPDAIAGGSGTVTGSESPPNDGDDDDDDPGDDDDGPPPPPPEIPRRVSYGRVVNLLATPGGPMTGWTPDPAGNEASWGPSEEATGALDANGEGAIWRKIDAETFRLDARVLLKLAGKVRLKELGLLVDLESGDTAGLILQNTAGTPLAWPCRFTGRPLPTEARELQLATDAPERIEEDADEILISIIVQDGAVYPQVDDGETRTFPPLLLGSKPVGISLLVSGDVTESIRVIGMTLRQP